MTMSMKVVRTDGLANMVRAFCEERDVKGLQRFLSRCERKKRGAIVLKLTIALLALEPGLAKSLGMYETEVAERLIAAMDKVTARAADAAWALVDKRNGKTLVFKDLLEAAEAVTTPAQFIGACR